MKCGKCGDSIISVFGIEGIRDGFTHLFAISPRNISYGGVPQLGTGWEMRMEVKCGCGCDDPTPLKEGSNRNYPPGITDIDQYARYLLSSVTGPEYAYRLAKDPYWRGYRDALETLLGGR